MIDARDLREERALVEIIEKGMRAQRQPGLNVGVWVPGRGSLVRAFGTADLGSDAPMQLEDHVRIASITKTFTGVAPCSSSSTRVD